MTQKFAAFEAFSARTSAQPLYSGEWSYRFETQIELSTNPGQSISIPFVPDQRPGLNSVVEVTGIAFDALGNTVGLSTISEINGWLINGVYTDNGSTSAINHDNAYGKGRVTPQYLLSIGGAARTAINAEFTPRTLITVRMEVRYRPTRYFSGFWQGFQTFGLVCEFPPNSTVGNQNADPNNMAQAIDGLLAKEFARGGRTYNVAAANQTPLVVGECMFAAIDCTGYITIQSSDVGLAAGQIPTNVVDNTAARYAYHPNTFFRQQSDKINGLACRYADPVGVSTINLGQPIGVYVNDNLIDYSDWLVVIDGAPQIVHLKTPDLISAYTPRQLWELVWVPILQGSQSVARSAILNSSLKLNRLAYLSYARCLSRFGTVLTQTNITPPG